MIDAPSRSDGLADTLVAKNQGIYCGNCNLLLTLCEMRKDFRICTICANHNEKAEKALKEAQERRKFVLLQPVA